MTPAAPLRPSTSSHALDAMPPQQLPPLPDPPTLRVAPAPLHHPTGERPCRMCGSDVAPFDLIDDQCGPCRRAWS